MSAFDPECVDVEDFLECLECRNVKQATEREMLFSCPFPAHSGGDENPSCYMNIETTAFFCHSCHEKGNAISFTQKVLEISPLEAIRMLKARYSPNGIDPDARSMTEEVRKLLDAQPLVQPENVILDPSIADRFALDWEAAHDAYERQEGHPACDYMFERGFDAPTLNLWGFGYDENSCRIVFPVCNEYGSLVGFKGRAHDGRQPKYLILGDRPNRPQRYGFTPYQISLIVFGLDRVIESWSAEATDDRTVIICEGELNVVALHQMGYTNAVAVQGSHFSNRQARLIRSYADRVILFLDSDSAGQEATERIAQTLNPHMPVFVTPDHEGDPASMVPSEVSDTIEKSVSHTVRELLRS